MLILSTIADVATDYVVKGLCEAGVDHLRVNTEDIPFLRTLEFSVGDGLPASLYLDGRHRLNPTSIWYRRLRIPAQPAQMQDGVYEFCLQETRSALLGSISSLPGRWMSRPSDVWRAELKPYQLAVAQGMGFRVPRTKITNDPLAIRSAFETFGPMVVKACRSGYAVVDGEERAIYTSRLLKEHLEYIDEARLSPAIYQEQIPKRYDIRATIVGNMVFAAAIDSQSDVEAAVDWRHTADPDLPHYPIELPDSVTTKLLQLMDHLGLTFGAADLVLTPNGDYVFIEVNPSGQWLWIDDKLQLGITDAIVSWLIGASA
ncbi:MAG TPA: hypothetical protein VK195_18575 [Burkholderiaceae bacterium]|nr:hypothetical protein [Burkholderiaceae bacterium]